MLDGLQTTRSNVEKQALKTEENIRGSIEECSRLEARLEAESEKYTYLQKLKGFIADLCDMLQVTYHCTHRLSTLMKSVKLA